jgi:translation elongation factor EF-Tu-like GTPase
MHHHHTSIQLVSRPGRYAPVTAALANMEPTLLFVVEDAFQIAGRGCILVPGPVAEAGGPDVRVGDPIRLVKPDGQTVDTEIQGIEMIGRRPPPKVMTAPILLPRDITKDQVPKGTHVLSLRDTGLANSYEALVRQ